MKKLFALLTVLLVLSLTLLPALATSGADESAEPDLDLSDVSGERVETDFPDSESADGESGNGQDVSGDDGSENETSNVPDESATAETSETDSDAPETSSEESPAEESPAEESKELEPGMDKLVYNLRYMGLGMLGIFVVIGVVIIVTVILNKVTEKK